ncbi:MAG: aminodeoxychorismate/anthranilate synthase component II [Sphingomonadales bacterium]
MILLVDNYDSFTFNLYQYACQLGDTVEVRRNDKITLMEIATMAPAGIIISPGPGRPGDAGICIDIIKNFSGKIPILGVCLGHQAIAEAYGGKVVHANEIAHGREGQVRHNGAGIFSNLPSPLIAGRYHSLAVELKSFPEVLKIDADLEDGTIMGLSHQSHPTFGVQFHPESVLTPEGLTIISNFLQGCRAQGPAKPQ